MSVDLQNSINDVKNRISAIQKTNKTLDELDQRVRTQVKDNLEKVEDKVISAVDQVKEQQKRLKRQVSDQLSNLLGIFQMNAGSGPGSTRYIKSRFIRILIKAQPVIAKILKDTMIDCVGCSQEQTYDTTSPIYIKLQSIDVTNMIKNYRPDVEEGANLYESTAPESNKFPFSMNRAIWQRTQKLGTSFSQDNNNTPYRGKSGQDLFDMKYVNNNGVEDGDFLEITLKNRQNSLNNFNGVKSFLLDYYSTINVFDINTAFAQMMEVLFGLTSISASVGYGDVTLNNKASLIIQRILGLCYDARNEIDVSGVSKVPELDGIDDDFFEFSDVDLRIIEQKTSDTLTGVVEFEDCQNIKLPVDPKPINAVLSQITAAVRDNDIRKIERLADTLTESVINNPQWKLRLPTTFNLEAKVNSDFIQNLPKALVFSLLTPKVLLPLFIMFKAMGQNVADFIDSIVDFFKKFKACLTKLISKIGAIFVKALFEYIKQDLLRLVRKMVGQINKEKAAKKYILYLKLAAIIALLVKAFLDWRKCKSVIDEIVLILNIIMMGSNKDDGISPFLLSVAGQLPGYSPTRALTNIIEELEKIGLPTGPAPSGAPNANLLAIKAKLDGEQKERLNQKGAALVPPLAVTPYGTLPKKISLLPDV